MRVMPSVTATQRSAGSTKCMCTTSTTAPHRYSQPPAPAAPCRQPPPNSATPTPSPQRLPSSSRHLAGASQSHTCTRCRRRRRQAFRSGTFGQGAFPGEVRLPLWLFWVDEQGWGGTASGLHLVCRLGLAIRTRLSWAGRALVVAAWTLRRSARALQNGHGACSCGGAGQVPSGLHLQRPRGRSALSLERELAVAIYCPARFPHHRSQPQLPPLTPCPLLPPALPCSTRIALRLRSLHAYSRRLRPGGVLVSQLSPSQ